MPMIIPKLSVRLVALFLVLSILLVLVVSVFIGRGITNELQELVGTLRAAQLTEELRKSALIQFGIGIFIVAMITGTAIWLIVGNPLRKIAMVTEEIGKGDLSRRIDTDETVDEIRHLALSFNWMADQQQKAFIEREDQIRKLVRTQRSLEISEERLRVIIDNSLDIIMLLRPNGEITFLSPSINNILGYHPDVITGESIYRYVHQDDYSIVHDILNQNQEELSSTATEIRVQHANTSWISIEMYYTNVSIGEEFRGKLINARDVTRWNELQQQLSQAQKMEALGNLSGGVAHDFNNMLTVIGAYADMLASEESDANHLEWIDEIRQATDRATNVTSQLLAFSRRQVLKPKIMNLNESVNNLHGMLHRLIGEDVTIELVLSDRIESILADPTQIDQVILNLAINAKDAMPEGGVLRITTRTGQTAGNSNLSKPSVVLEVSDNGHGIDQNAISQIFDPFYTTKGLGKGTGLGLSTVQGIVEQSNGTIEVESTPGIGTAFRLSFPVSRLEIGSVSDNSKNHEALPPHSHGRIMVVEDDPSILKFIELSLQKHGCIVVTASNARDAIIKMDSDFDMLITDIILPGDMNGTALSERFESSIPSIAVLYISGYTGETHDSSAFLRLDRLLLTKPFSQKSLLIAVDELLAISRG